MNKEISNVTRFITLHGDINSTVAKETIDQILYINNIYSDHENEKDFSPKPIVLYVNGFGGIVQDAMAIVDTIQSSVYPIYTVCTGYAMSANVLIYLAGHRRFCTEHASFLIHQISAGCMGALKDMEDCVDKYKDVNEMTYKYIVNRTNITHSQLKNITNMKRDWTIYAQEAKRLGIATDIMRSMKVLYK